MKQLHFIGLIMFLICMSCDQDTTLMDENRLAENRSNDVIVCHLTGNGTYIQKQINENALQAHLNHGDLLPSAWYADVDEDGYGDPDVEIVSCFAPTGYISDNMDCDDQSPSVNPGVSEVCDNDIDDDCDGQIDEYDDDCALGCVPGELQVVLPDGTFLYVYPTDISPDPAWGILGVDIGALTNYPSPSSASVDFDGAGNTQKIMAQLGSWNGGNYAAKLCTELSNETGCDWYLPSAGELLHIADQHGPPIYGSGGINYGGSGELANNTVLMSSTEAYDVYYFWAKPIDSSSNFWVGGKHNTFIDCRCVRK